MKSIRNILLTTPLTALVLFSSYLAPAMDVSAGAMPATTAIPRSQLGATAGADYRGDALAVIPSTEGARLRCEFQRLEGEATREGLWLTSTVVPPAGTVNDRFRLVAVEVGRGAPPAVDGVTERSANIQQSTSGLQLPATGNVYIDGQTVRFTRPGLVEEYTTSMDGVRQDFVVMERPPGVGELVLRLAVSGARVESAAFGAQVVLENSGRRISYDRLHVTDANGRELPARLEVAPESEIRNPKSESLRVVVNDVEAVYPVRIDPTFSDANWSSMGGVAGADGSVGAAVVDGLGNLYIGGSFNVAGEVIASRVAKWDGSSWSALGSGINGTVYALAVSGSTLYAGGEFTTAGGHAAANVAKWNGSSWSALGSGINGSVSALAASGSTLYVRVGGQAANNIAMWDGESWSAVGSGIDGHVAALAVSGGDLYAGGTFTNAGGIMATNIAKWDGSSWSALGSGIDGGVSALAVSGSELYAAGWFTTAGGNAVRNIAKWDGSSWSALGSGILDWSLVSALAVSGNDVYAAGRNAAGGSPANYIAKWNGSSWSPLGSDVNYYVYALAASGSNLYAAGEFNFAGDVIANHVAKWNGSIWSALGSGMNAGFITVDALARSDSDLYVGGWFRYGSAANNIGKWNGSSWSALGSGMGGGDPYWGPWVSAMAVSGSDLYAAGNFTTAGGSQANYIAKWDVNSWSALGSGMGGSSQWVLALAVSGSDLYAGGAFTTAGGSQVNYIAKWDGSSWSALGSGMGGGDGPIVTALAVSGSDLYAGGRFTTAGGNAANRIAKWDGSSWFALGSGMNGTVYALAVSGNDLYAGGSFTRVGGIAANRIAKWDGSTWSALGSGMNEEVSALAVSGSDLYAGGSFTAAGGSAASHIAKWDGSSWSALGSGMNGTVRALAVSGSDLYAGGSFLTAGGKVSVNIARAYLPALPTLSVLHSNEQVTISWPAVDTAGFALEQTGSLAAPSLWVPISATITDDGANKSVTLPATDSPQFFRLRRP